MNATATQNSRFELASPIPATDAAGERTHGSTGVCPVCMEPLLPEINLCPRCLNKVGQEESELQAAREGAATAPAPKIASGTVYTIEMPVRCPECEDEIRTFRVLRVLRTQASFTSTLPRKGYVVVCPSCERMLSAELSGLV